MDYHQSTFQMLGQNMFPKGPPSGQLSLPEKQSQQNKEKFDQLIQLMNDQQQRVENYNTSMKQREDQLQQLELQSQQLQKNLVQQDKLRNQHNNISYKNYQPGFNVKQEEPEAEAAQSLHSSKYQQYNQGIQPEELEQIQMSQNPRRNSVQVSEPRPQTNKKLLSIQKQIEEQNEYIQQLTALVQKKPNSAQTPDSLEALLNEREDLKKQQLLNEVQQLKEKLSGLQNRQPQIQYPQMQYPQMQYPQMQYPQMQYPQMQYPQMQYPLQMPPPPQNQEEESDDDDLTKQLMMKLMMQQEPRKHRHKRKKDVDDPEQ